MRRETEAGQRADVPSYGNDATGLPYFTTLAAETSAMIG